jgi:hypothetical protein
VAIDHPFRHTHPDTIAEDMGPGHFLQHGDPAKWKPIATPRRMPASGPGAMAGDLKVIETWENEFGGLIEYHYFRYADGSRSVGKLVPYSP